jgi:outer membrane biosynthesis protein TonB
MSQDKKQGRKLGFAILISLVLHLAVGFSLAAFGNVSAPPIPTDEAPPEITMMDLSPAPEKEKNPQFVETEKSKESAEKPNDQTFESNANSLAASERAPSGDLPLPSQDGKDLPTRDLETHDFSLQTQGSVPQPEQPTPPPEQSKPTPAPLPTPTAAPDQLAMLTSTPPPPIKAPDETQPSPTPEKVPSLAPVAPRPKPETPSSSYQAQKQQTRVAGSISNRGPSSVNAVGTPLGRYQKMLYDMVGSRWYQHTHERQDLISIGTTRLTFTIDRGGRVSNLKIIENTANETFANICLQSVQELKLPPIPEDVAGTLPSEGLQQELTFILYAN